MIKYLTYIVVLANLVMGLWIYANPAPQDPRELIKPIPANKRLVLLNEVSSPDENTEAVAQQSASTDTTTNAADTSEPIEEALTTNAPDATEANSTGQEIAENNNADNLLEESNLSAAQALPILACYTVGPFTTRSLAETYASTMQTQGLTVSQREKIEQLNLGYRVYIEPLENREAAIALTRELNNLGINDYFIINDDAYKNGISLGLFKQKSGAIRRMAQIRRFNFEVAMEARQRETTIVWLDIEDNNAQFSEEYWQELSESDTQLQRLSKKCDTPIALL